jgi:hypothetical protein
MRNVELEKEFKIKRSGKNSLAYSAECNLDGLSSLLKYIDVNDNFKTPFRLKVNNITLLLGKDGLSGRVFIDSYNEKEFNLEMSNFHSPPQEFIELRTRICYYL